MSADKNIQEILAELRGLRSDLSDRAASIEMQQNAGDAHALAQEALVDQGMMHPPIPLRPDDIRREGPPTGRVIAAPPSPIVQKLHDADMEARAILPDPRPGHTWSAELEPTYAVRSTDAGQEFTTILKLVYKQVRL